MPAITRMNDRDLGREGVERWRKKYNHAYIHVQCMYITYVHNTPQVACSVVHMSEPACSIHVHAMSIPSAC